MKHRISSEKRCSIRFASLAVAVLVGGIAGCPMQPSQPMSNDMAPPDETLPSVTTISFSQQVQLIFTNHCSGCHSPGGLADVSGIALKLREGESYDLLINQPSVQIFNQSLVIPGDSASSLLLAKVSSLSPPVGSRMPLFAPMLSDTDISTIRDWIDQGALNN